MGAKRALIVDDSKSARLFLARILERYGIDVDNADSAEKAIEYLATERPDVIFMDHLMPGMDGFQAVQAIKNNPRTATIPILMYTSQEGELYLGQARALGAVGVLPKQIMPADVSKVLYQLHLVADRRRPEQSTFQAVDELPMAVGSSAPAAMQNEPRNGAGAAQAPGAVPQAVLAVTEKVLREQFADLRRALLASIDTQTDRIVAQVRAAVPAPPQVSPTPAAPAPHAFLETLTPPPAPKPWGWGLATAVALTVACVSTAYTWSTLGTLHAMAIELGELRAAVAGRKAGAPVASAPVTHQDVALRDPKAVPGPVAGAVAAVPKGPAAEGKPTVVQVPYGADPLGGARLEAIRQLVYRLANENVGGVVEIRTFAGRFCLIGNATDGFSLAPEEMPFAKCDLVGNPFDDALSPAQRMPLGLANLIGDVRHSTGGKLQLQAFTGDAANLAAPYPTLSSDLTAGEWNRAAGFDNRLEIRVR